MNEIEIKDVQNVAQNMIVGSKQHSLFKTVINNNPSLISDKPSACEYTVSNEEGLEIAQMSVNSGNKSFEAVAVTGFAKPECRNGNIGTNPNNVVNNAPRGLNSQLYGMLKPCKKQFNVGQNQDIEKHENNQDY